MVISAIQPANLRKDFLQKFFEREMSEVPMKNLTNKEQMNKQIVKRRNMSALAFDGITFSS
jgi:hypothetical protein